MSTLPHSFSELYLSVYVFYTLWLIPGAGLFLISSMNRLIDGSLGIDGGAFGNIGAAKGERPPDGTCKFTKGAYTCAAMCT